MGECVIMKLTRDSWRDVFDFLTLFDIGKIHMAVASDKRYRDMIRSILYNYTMIYEDSVIKRFAREWFAWMQKYSVYDRYVVIWDDESVNDDDIIAFANHSGQKLLSFSFCIFDGPTSDRSIVHLAQACPLLHDCQFSTNMTDIGLDALAVYCPDLDFTYISSASISNITTAGFLAFQSRRPKVEHFEILSHVYKKGCDFYAYMSSDEIIEWIRISCSAETTKHVHIDMAELFDKNFEFDKFNDDVLIALVNQCPHIESFSQKGDLMVITNRGIRFLADNCKSLVDFSMTFNQELVSHDFDHTSIVECLLKCPIHTLNLKTCVSIITDEFLFKFPIFPKIRKLTFDVGGVELSNVGMGLISEKFPNLEELEIRNYPSLPFVTDDGIDVVIQKCPFIKKLRIENAAITQEGFDRWMRCDQHENAIGHLTTTKIQYAQLLLQLVNYREEYSYLRDYYDKRERYFTVASMEWRKNGGDGYEISKFHDEDDAHDCYLEEEDDIPYESDDDEEKDDEEVEDDEEETVAEGGDAEEG